MASVGETDNISGNWQEKQSYFQVEKTILEMKVSVCPGFCIFAALNSLWSFGKIISLFHTSFHLTGQDNDSRRNTQCLKG